MPTSNLGRQCLCLAPSPALPSLLWSFSTILTTWLKRCEDHQVSTVELSLPSVPHILLICESSYHPLSGRPTACWVKSKFSAGQHSWLQSAFGFMPLTLYTTPTFRAAELCAFSLWTTFQPSFVLPPQHTKQPSLQGLTCSLHGATFAAVLSCSSHAPILFSRGYDQLADLSGYLPHPSLCSHPSSALCPFLLRAPPGIARELHDEARQGLRPADPLQSCFRSLPRVNPLL